MKQKPFDFNRLQLWPSLHEREKFHIAPHCPAVQILQGLHRTGAAVKLSYILFSLPLFCRTQWNTAKWWEGFFSEQNNPRMWHFTLLHYLLYKISYRGGNELLLDMNRFNLERLWQNWWIMQKILELSAEPFILFSLLISSVFTLPVFPILLSFCLTFKGIETCSFFPSERAGTAKNRSSRRLVCKTRQCLHRWQCFRS